MSPRHEWTAEVEIEAEFREGQPGAWLVGGGVSVCARVFVCVCVCIQDGPEPFLSQYMENQEPWSVSVSFVPEEGETLS